MKKRFILLIYAIMVFFTGGMVCHASAGCQKILVISSNEGETDVSLMKNIKLTYKTAKLNFSCMNSNSYELGKALKKLDKQRDLLVIATDNLGKISLQTKIIEYVKNGGKAFFPVLGTGEEALLNLAGVKKFEKTEEVVGLIPKAKYFPGLDTPEKGQLMFRSGSGKVILDKNVKILIEAENKFPVAWRYSFEKGEVIVFNSNLLAESSFSGLLIQLTAMLNDYFLTTIFNAKVVYIDDFPFPVPLGSEYTITSNYDGRSYEEFYKDIWWPQLKALARKYDMKYTCLVLANYANSTEMPPFKIPKKVKDDIKYYGDDLLKNGHELGIHGYNHASLLCDDYKKELAEVGYKPWKSTADMVTSLKALKNVLKEEFGQRKYYSYVPPMNMFSKEGKKAVLTVFPEMICFAGLGDPNLNERGVLHQEIGLDSDYPQVYGLPRFSSGHLYEETEMWIIYSYIAFCGLFSHFIHPDDLMDPERSGNKTWEKLHDDLARIFRNVDKNFPFLRAMTSEEFAKERFKTIKMKVFSQLEGNVITIKYTGGNTPLFHYLKLNNGKRIQTVKNGTFQPVGKVKGLYFIKGIKSPVKVVIK